MRKVAFLFFACVMAFVSCQETLNSIDDSLPSSDSESMDTSGLWIILLGRLQGIMIIPCGKTARA